MRRARHLLKGDVLEVVLLDDGRPQRLVVGHELGEGDAQRRRHIKPKPVCQLGPQLHTKPMLRVRVSTLNPKNNGGVMQIHSPEQHQGYTWRPSEGQAGPGTWADNAQSLACTLWIQTLTLAPSSFIISGCWGQGRFPWLFPHKPGMWEEFGHASMSERIPQPQKLLLLASIHTGIFLEFLSHPHHWQERGPKADMAWPHPDDWD